MESPLFVVSAYARVGASERSSNESFVLAE